ncbi:UNVERIFIED_CONTAM: DEAD/DEAH box helicase family protein [Campylobacter lari]
MEYSVNDRSHQKQSRFKTREGIKKADYVLYSDKSCHFPIAIIEAKSIIFSEDKGLSQAQQYARYIKENHGYEVPFVFSTNGNKFVFFNRIKNEIKRLEIDEFPTHEELINLYLESKNISDESKFITEPSYYTYLDKNVSPRYYQTNAINKTLEAVATGKNRILLVMATGTGKTFTAFQIVHCLREAKKVKKVLFLADRNILIDQTLQNDFKPLAKVATKIEGTSNKKIDPSFEIYFSLYQQLVKNVESEEQPYKDLSPDFFDLIIVDECHRGSADENSR